MNYVAALVRNYQPLYDSTPIVEGEQVTFFRVPTTFFEFSFFGCGLLVTSVEVLVFAFWHEIRLA